MKKQLFILGTIVCLSQVVFAIEATTPIAHLKPYIQEMLQVEAEAILVPKVS